MNAHVKPGDNIKIIQDTVYHRISIGTVLHVTEDNLDMGKGLKFIMPNNITYRYLSHSDYIVITRKNTNNKSIIELLQQLLNTL